MRKLSNMFSALRKPFSLLSQVETIGDAYMVVGGVPVPIESHALRVANFALGMRISAKEVINPVTGEPIQVQSNLLNTNLSDTETRIFYIGSDCC